MSSSIQATFSQSPHREEGEVSHNSRTISSIQTSPENRVDKKLCTEKEEEVKSDISEPTAKTDENSVVVVPSAQIEEKSDIRAPTPSDIPTPTSLQSVFSGIKTFDISDKLKLVLQRGDITKWYVDGHSDAIVNAANEMMLGGGGVDGAIHRVAGPQLFDACKNVPQVANDVRCPTGEARITPGFLLPASHVIHTVGPIYHNHDVSAPKLEAAYRNSLLLAQEKEIKFICFCAISCGIYGYPHSDAAKIALNTIKKVLQDDDNSVGIKEVHFVLFDQSTYHSWTTTAQELFRDEPI